MGGAWPRTAAPPAPRVEDEGSNCARSTASGKRWVIVPHVNVTSFNRQVLLTGEVPTVQDRATVDQIVAG